MSRITTKSLDSLEAAAKKLAKKNPMSALQITYLESENLCGLLMTDVHPRSVRESFRAELDRRGELSELNWYRDQDLLFDADF